jgi:hypothetical protein
MADAKILKADYKYVPVDPEPGFSPIRNKAIVQKTIEKYEKMRKKSFAKFGDQTAERIDVLASWITSPNHSGKPLDQYISRRYLGQLAGEKILSRLEKLKKFRMEHPNVIIT